MFNVTLLQDITLCSSLQDNNCLTNKNNFQYKLKYREEKYRPYNLFIYK